MLPYMKASRSGGFRVVLYEVISVWQQQQQQWSILFRTLEVRPCTLIHNNIVRQDLKALLRARYNHLVHFSFFLSTHVQPNLSFHYVPRFMWMDFGLVSFVWLGLPQRCEFRVALYEGIST